MKIIFFSIIFFMSCSFISYTNSHGRQKVILRDKNNRIIKTSDGKVYWLYDTLGRTIETWGHCLDYDCDYYYHDLIYHTDTSITVKGYKLSYDNKECKIRDTADYLLSLYTLNHNGKCIHITDWKAVKDDRGKVIARKIYDDGPNHNNFDVKEFYSLPRYLKSNKD